MLEISPVRSLPIDDCPGYFVWDVGKVWCMHNTRRRPCDPREIKGYATEKGYVRVTLHRGPGQPRMKFIHNLVLEAFVGPRPDGMEGCHWDGDKKHNAIGNLRWDTPAANAADNRRLGRIRPQRGSNNGNARLTEPAVAEIKKWIERGLARRKIMGMHGLTHNQFHKIKQGRTWTHVTI